jgi:DNA repair protein RadC
MCSECALLARCARAAIGFGMGERGDGSGNGGDAVKPHFHGHRQRLRRRLLEGGTEALPDYELLEFLLFTAQPRGDMKPLAKALIERFRSLAAVLSAEPQSLLAIPGMGEASVAALKAVREAGQRLLRAEVANRPVLSSWTQLLAYCQAAAGHAEVEEFRLLFLDRKNALIADERQQRGTVDHTPVYPREVVKRALELGASALIMVHNHPSGDPTPSQADIEMTREVQRAAAVLGVTLHDHLILARGRHTSLRSLGLI